MQYMDALQTALRSCPCEHPSCYIHLVVHAGVLYLKTNLISFSEKGEIIRAVR